MNLPPFQRLIDEHWLDVARLARALAGPVDGDDVAQQTWVQALAAYPSLTSAGNLRGWLLTITYRCAADLHRARSRRAVPVAEVTDLARAQSAPSIVDGDPAVWAAVQGLPERQRTALALRYVLDLEHRELARTMGTTPAATRRLVSDALAAVRSALGEGPRS